MSVKRTVALVEDEELLDDVLKLAAAAGCAVERVADTAQARAHWNSAPLVILDADSARECRELGLARRGGVALVVGAPPPTEVWRDAVRLGAERVIELPTDEDWLVRALADVAEAPADSAGRVLAVLGSRGGAGASVFAVAAGLSVLRAKESALLIDCDALAGGLDLVLGAESDSGLRWPDMRLRGGRVAMSSLHAALPGRTEGSARLSLLSGAREGMAPEPDAVAAVIEAGRRGGETVICDLPRNFDDCAHTVLERSDLTVMIVPAEVRACVAAKIMVSRLAERGHTAELIVRGPAPGRLSPDEVAEAVGLPLLHSMRPEPGVARMIDRGEFKLKLESPLAKAARVTLRALTRDREVAA
jgi:secretion/DNA translocation related CpaE-like protein